VPVAGAVAAAGRRTRRPAARAAADGSRPWPIPPLSAARPCR